MSTLMQDRLVAALRARAEQVQPYDLRPLDVPVVGMRDARRRRRTAVVAGLAAVAAAAAVAGPLLLGGRDGTGSPQPTGPTESRPTGASQRPGPGLAADLDGDGRTDTVRLVEEEARVRLVVVLAGGEQVETPVEAAAPDATPLAVGDLGGTAGQEVLVPVSEDPADLPAVYTWLSGEGLARAEYPGSGLEGWRAGIPQNRWAVLEDGLRTWEAETVPGDDRYPYWDWSVDDDGRLRPGTIRLGCAAPADVPEPCGGRDEKREDAPDVGPRGDLPVLMPAVEETRGEERYHYGTGPARADYVQLQGNLYEEGGAVEAGQVELVVTASGVEHRVGVPAGQSPRLVPQTLALRGDAPAFVVLRSGGDTSVVELYSFWNGELVELEPDTDVFLGSGFVDHEGEMTEQRTWITPDGRMFTAVLLDHETRRHQLWQWDDNAGRAVTTVDLGEACLDWESGSYGRCP